MPKSPSPLRISVDRTSTVPAYRQLADELRYRIATGDLALGTRLPTVAEGGKLWRVNLHTVRRAYEILAGEGLVDMQRGRGTTVIAKASLAPAGAREGAGAFADWAAAHATREFGLTAAEFADLITASHAKGKGGQDVPIVECSDHQAGDLAAQLSASWKTKTRGWSLERPDEPPAGPFVATYFHYNDIRRRWPHRMKDAFFISIRPADVLRERLKAFGRGKDAPKVHLVERDESMARSIAADVSQLLPSRRYMLVTDVIKDQVAAFKLSEGEYYLFSPRLWAALRPAQRAAANTAEVEYTIAEDEQLRVARHFSWQPATAQTPS